MYKTALFLFIFFVFTGFLNRTDEKLNKGDINPPFLCCDTNWADSVFNSLNNDERIAQLFMVHPLGHSIGIDVHDTGDINILKNNMVITIEPGIYFTNRLNNNEFINKKELAKYKSIGGIRIEDVIQVTIISYKNLTPLTKTLNGIEKLIKN